MSLGLVVVWSATLCELVSLSVMCVSVGQLVGYLRLCLVSGVRDKGEKLLAAVTTDVREQQRTEGMCVCKSRRRRRGDINQ